MLMAIVLMDIRNPFNSTQHPDIFYKLSEYTFHEVYFSYLAHLSDRKFKVHMQKNKAGVPLGFILVPTMYSVYIHDVPTTPGTCNALFADDTSICKLRGTSICV
jgi:hypothetical protein